MIGVINSSIRFEDSIRLKKKRFAGPYHKGHAVWNCESLTSALRSGALDRREAIWLYLGSNVRCAKLDSLLIVYIDILDMGQV